MEEKKQASEEAKMKPAPVSSKRPISRPMSMGQLHTLFVDALRFSKPILLNKAQAIGRTRGQDAHIRILQAEHEWRLQRAAAVERRLDRVRQVESVEYPPGHDYYGSEAAVHKHARQNLLPRVAEMTMTTVHTLQTYFFFKVKNI